MERAAFVADRPDPTRVCRDPDDDHLVALANAARADSLVSGDDDLLALEREKVGVEVVMPRELADRLG